jgi:uncharacterized membrane protein YkoI
MRLRRRTVVTTTATAAVLAVAGGVAVAAGDDEEGLSRTGTVSVDESALPDDDAAEQSVLAGLTTVDQAAAEAAAEEAVDGGEALFAQLDEEDDYVVWEVQVRAADGSLQEVTVDAGDASILATHVEDDLSQAGTVRVDEAALPEDDAAELTALAALATVGQAAAGDAAVDAVGGGAVLSAELDYEEGFVVWEVDVRGTDGSLWEVTVDAGDASILATGREDD